MAAGFVLAITAEGKVCLVRKRSKQVKRSACVWLRHLGAKMLFECAPGLFVFRGLRLGDQLGRRGQDRIPDVIKISACKLCLRHSARRTAHRTEAQPFVFFAWSPEPDDLNGHFLPPRVRPFQRAISPDRESWCRASRTFGPCRLPSSASPPRIVYSAGPCNGRSGRGRNRGSRPP